MTINDSVDDPPQHIARLRRGGGRLNHAVYGELRERLLSGRYAAGARLSTEELRTEFGVSKQPVMEALRRLSADGMVEIVPQVGSLVAVHEPTRNRRLLPDVQRIRGRHRRHRCTAPHRHPSWPSSTSSRCASMRCAASGMRPSDHAAIAC